MASDVGAAVGIECGGVGGVDCPPRVGEEERRPLARAEGDPPPQKQSKDHQTRTEITSQKRYGT